MLKGKGMIMKIIVQLRKAKPKNLVGNNKEQDMAPFLRYVSLDPIHCIRVQKSPAPGRHGD